MDLFLRIDLSQGSLHSSMLVNEVINEVSSVFVLQSLLIHPSLVKESLQIWINIVEIEPVIGIPPDMTDVLEISWESNVFFLDLPLVTLLGCWSVVGGTEQRILTTSTRVCSGSDSTIDNAIG